MNNPTFFRLSSGLYINLHQITRIWMGIDSNSQPIRRFLLVGDPATYTMTEDEFNQNVDL